MNNETLLSQAKIEAEKRYNSGDGYMANRYAFTAGVEYAITHLQAQEKRLWHWVIVKCEDDLPKENCRLLAEFRDPDLRFWEFTQTNKRHSLNVIARYLEPYTVPAQENEAVGFAEFVNRNYTRLNAEKFWKPRTDGGLLITNNLKTTAQLYTLYKSKQ